MHRVYEWPTRWRHLEVGAVRLAEWVVRDDPVLERGVQLGVVAALVPDEIDEVELLVDGFSRPAAAARPQDQLDAGVGAANIVAQVLARDCRRHEVVVRESRRWAEPER